MRMDLRFLNEADKETLADLKHTKYWPVLKRIMSETAKVNLRLGFQESTTMEELHRYRGRVEAMDMLSGTIESVKLRERKDAEKDGTGT